MKKIFYSLFAGLALTASALTANAQTLANPAIEGTWNITLDGKYSGIYSLGQFTEAFTATLDGNTVTFESTGSSYNIVAEFTAENTLTFNKTVVFGEAAEWPLYQIPFVNNSGIDNADDLTEEVFTATFNPTEGTISFPENSGLAYGRYNKTTGNFMGYMEDAFDLISAVQEGKGETPNYGDPSIEGEWDFTLDGHYLGEYSINVFTEKMIASLEGNTVTFTSTGSQYDIVAEFVGVNTLQFNKAPVGPASTYTLYQYPYINNEDIQELEELPIESFQATYDSNTGTLVFPLNAGLRYAYVNADGVVEFYDDAFDFVSASKSGEPAEVIGSYYWMIQPTDLLGSTEGEAMDIQIEVRKDGDNYYIYEMDNTRYLNNQPIPFTYSEATGMATFKAHYAGEFGGEPTWLAAFLFNGSFIEPQDSYGVEFDPEIGFTFPQQVGFGWYITDSAASFNPSDVFSAFYVLESGTSAIKQIQDTDLNGEVMYFDLQGRRVMNPKDGIFIMKSGNVSKKVLIKN